MIVITGSKGFIGQNFLKYLVEYSNEEIVTVGEKEAWDWIGLFKEWDKDEVDSDEVDVKGSNVKGVEGELSV